MATDHLGRELADKAPKAQTVTEFAVESGTIPKDAPGVQETIRADRKHAEEATERAKTVSAAMAPAEESAPSPTVAAPPTPPAPPRSSTPPGARGSGTQE
jgi:hypothetical protein